MAQVPWFIYIQDQQYIYIYTQTKSQSRKEVVSFATAKAEVMQSEHCLTSARAAAKETREQEKDLKNMKVVTRVCQ